MRNKFSYINYIYNNINYYHFRVANIVVQTKDKILVILALMKTFKTDDFLSSDVMYMTQI